MTAGIIDGRARSKEILEEVRRGAEAFVREKGRPVGLAMVSVGGDPASLSYMRGREKAAREAGFYSEVHRLGAGMGTGVLRRFVKRLSEDDSIDGVLLALPLPGGLDAEEVLRELSPEKDVDGVTALNQGKLLAGRPGLRPCTPRGVMDLLQSHGVDLSGRAACVLGRSPIVGKPMALMLLEADATVTVAHSRTRDLKEITRRAEVLVVAVGKPGFLTPDMVSPGAVVVDVGIHQVDGKIKGDVADRVAEVAGALTPVPGGVGPMTVAMLMKQTLEAALCRS